MKSYNHYSDDALVLRKTKLKDSHHSITLLTKHHGKYVLTAFGTRRLLSRRLSHLETGNVIRCSWREDGDYATLQETELHYAHSQIKEDSQKLDFMYLILFVLFKILPEKEPETEVYESTLRFLKTMHKQDTTVQNVEKFVQKLLMDLGFIDEEQASAAHFDVFHFIEGIIGRKIKV